MRINHFLIFQTIKKVSVLQWSIQISSIRFRIIEKWPSSGEKVARQYRYRPGHVTAHFRRHNPVLFSIPQMDSDIDVLKGNPHGRLYNTTSVAGHLRLLRNASRNDALKASISSVFFRAILSGPATLPDKMESMRSGLFRKKKAEKR